MYLFYKGLGNLMSARAVYSLIHFLIYTYISLCFEAIISKWFLVITTSVEIALVHPIMQKRMFILNSALQWYRLGIGSVAMWSKALVLGTSLSGGVGSNPTTAMVFINLFEKLMTWKPRKNTNLTILKLMKQMFSAIASCIVINGSVAERSKALV